MIQEEKSLLLKDLCARSPYGVKVSLQTGKRKLIGVLDAVYPTDDRVIVDNLNEAIAPINVRTGGFLIERNNVKPYLRPMSSMTEEEKEELYHYYCKEIADNLNTPNLTWEIRCCVYNSFGIDWLNTYHFDYRRLIEKGLALEAPEDMYK